MWYNPPNAKLNTARHCTALCTSSSLLLFASHAFGDCFFCFFFPLLEIDIIFAITKSPHHQHHHTRNSRALTCMSYVLQLYSFRGAKSIPPLHYTLKMLVKEGLIHMKQCLLHSSLSFAIFSPSDLALPVSMTNEVGLFSNCL